MVIPVITMAGLVNTTRARTSTLVFGILKKISKLGLCALVIVYAAGVFYLSIPRMSAAFLTISGDKVYDQLTKGKTASARHLDVLEESRWKSLGWIVDGKTFADLSIAKTARREILAESEHAELYREISSLIRKSLSLAPANGRAWLHLAGAEDLINGDTKLKLDALTMSMLTRPVLAIQTFYRLEMAIASKRFKESGNDRLLFRQIRITQKLMASKIVEFSAESFEKIALFRAALASDPDVYDQYNSSLARFFYYRAKRRPAL
jgi:hypothetical protein